MSAQNVMIGALTGLVAGVAIGLLVAPVKGSDARQKIADTADSIKRRFLHFGRHAHSELDELKGLLESESSGLKEDVKQRVLKLIEASKKSYNNLKEEAMIS